MSNEESNAEKVAYNLGRYVIGPILMMFIFALPIWMIWNGTLRGIFPMLSPITYIEAFSLCAIVWCFGVIWRGGINGKS